jgi:ech hydrogenase subunit C
MQGLKKSPWILHYDASSCNGCDIETLACLTPIFDVERLGVVNTGNPKHADIFLVTGAVNEQSKVVIQNLYRQLPEPKVVVAVGACAATGGIFRECYNISGGVDIVVPVDVYVPGCAARPEAIIDGVVKGLAVMAEKQTILAAARGSLDKTLYARAAKPDAAAIHALRKAAAQTDAVLHGDDTFPILQQTLEELQKELDWKFFFKAVVNGKIIGSISGCLKGETASVDRPSVHPYFQNTDVARRLLEVIEEVFRGIKRLETFAANKNQRLLQDLVESGYEIFKTEVFTPKITWVYLQKERK